MAEPDLYEELLKLTAALRAHHVPYALCGGLALAVYGFPRATKDIDILIEQGALSDVCRVAKSCGFTLRGAGINFRSGMRLERLIKPLPPSEESVLLDLLIVTDASRKAWDQRIEVETARGPVWVVSPAGLKSMKLLRNSLQDQADIENLDQLQS